MSTEKKLTPLQEAIEWLKSERYATAGNLRQRAVNGTIASTILQLELMLPKEKEFARDMWQASETLEDYRWAKGAGHTSKPPTFEEFYKQYEQS